VMTNRIFVSEVCPVSHRPNIGHNTTTIKLSEFSKIASVGDDVRVRTKNYENQVLVHETRYVLDNLNTFG
jgi:hypothetical protein